MSQKNIAFGFAAPTFAGYGDTHIDTPCIERITFDIIRDSSILAEKLGFDSVWLPDHLMLGRDKEIFEVWTTLSALATVTSNIRLGSLVVNTMLRHPGLLAKMASTLDIISNGRLILGLGSGSIPPEMDAYGFTYPTKVTDRVQLLEEVIAILKALWSGRAVNHEGRFFKLRNAICTPVPVQKPHPPILIGALTDSSSVHRVAARNADMYNTIGTVDVVSKRINMLRDFCSQEGRDFSRIVISLDAHVLIGKDEREVEEKKRKIVSCSPNYPAVKWKSLDSEEKMQWKDFEEFNFVGTPAQITEKLMSYTKVGCRYFTLWFLDLPKHDGLKLFAQTVIPNFTNSK